ncbi:MULTISPECIES: OmpA family protein [Vibrio]|uniref:Glycine zipper 2TM domain-containing protein n=1 Tax=Vibrio casei TaxID=673372 RepID=A0A368LJE6_9VIBR|nr:MULTISPECIES: OmpA family protein [Vibrio]RCS70872.1 glycine zipper 2TM domain-containing protein [Vibrio casei]SJN40409.1 Outer membrane lipoprotein omp16 precursor [Vibrio casei]HBV76655.1 glycine zipper 2TM domain-containing protein [Vibrio sp.]
MLSSMKLKALVIAGAVLTVTACESTNPYTGESQTSKSTTGALIGAAAGAAIGVASSSKSDRGKGALIGAASGATLGGGIGYYMDSQAKKLEQELRATGISVTQSGNNIILNMPNSLTFDVDQTELSNTAKRALFNVAKVVNEYDETNINILGYTDSSGSDAYNLRLSEVRANQVDKFLVSNKVKSTRINSVGKGEANPIASNSTAAGRAQNRRVEIILSPMAK